MHETAFDQLTKSIGDGVSRRGLLRALAGGGLTLGLLGRTAVQDAAAKSCKKIKDKKKRKKCLAKATSPTAQPPAGDPPAPPPACGSGGPCRVFLSSTLHGGNLGGLRGADAICQGLAEEANLPGTYKAWLSDSTSSPASRFVPSSGPYQLVTGTTIAATFTDLTDGVLAAPINVTETGGGIGATASTWTHTRTDGTPGGAFGDLNCCENWTTSSNAGPAGNVGRAIESGSGWTHAPAVTCVALFHPQDVTNDVTVGD